MFYPAAGSVRVHYGEQCGAQMKFRGWEKLGRKELKMKFRSVANCVNSLNISLTFDPDNCVYVCVCVCVCVCVRGWSLRGLLLIQVLRLIILVYLCLTCYQIYYSRDFRFFLPPYMSYNAHIYTLFYL